MSFLAPKNGVLNVWLAPFGKLDAAKAITDDKKRGIRQHHWADDGRHILSYRTRVATRNWRGLQCRCRNAQTGRPDATRQGEGREE